MSVFIECRNCGFQQDVGWVESYDYLDDDDDSTTCPNCENHTWDDA